MIIFGSVGFILTYLVITKLSGPLKTLFQFTGVLFFIFIVSQIVLLVWKVALIIILILSAILVVWFIASTYQDRKKEKEWKNSSIHKNAVNRWQIKMSLANQDLSGSGASKDEIILYAKDISNERADEYMKEVK